MSDNVNESREKFKKVLSVITPQKVVSDDTFLEKIQSYLTFSGNLHNVFFMFSYQFTHLIS